jgi:predicted  nucleic acid-binding Zn-ribbon protein
LAGELQKLFKLQGIDLALLERQREVERYEERFRDRRHAREQLQKTIEEATLVRNRLVGERALAERHVSERRELLKERRARVARIQTERELRAGETEIHDLTEEIDSHEDALLGTMEKVEEIEARLSRLKTESATLDKADDLEEESEGTRIADLREDLSREKGARDEMAGAIDGLLRKRYEMVLDRRGGLAVVEVQGSTCGGCHMTVPPQTLIEIMKTGAVRVCPNCQRILFVTAAEEGES